MDRLIAITVVVLAIPGSAMAGLSASTGPRGLSVARPATDTPAWVAKKTPKKKAATPAAAPAAPASAAPAAVKIVSPGNDKLTMQQKKSSAAAYLVEPGKAFKVELVGDGKLTLYLHQLVPAGGKLDKKASANVSIDGKKAKKTALSTKADNGTKVVERAGAQVTSPKSVAEKLKAGKHTAEVSVAKGSPAVLVIVDFFPTGAKKAAPIIAEGGPPPEVASAGTPGEAGTPVSSGATPEPPTGPGTPTPTETPTETPTATAGGSTGEPPPPGETPEQALQRRIVQGEIREGILGTYEPATVTKSDGKETLEFYRVPEEKSFTIMVAGPGELTIRLHRLIDPVTAATQEGAAYSIAMLEDDVLLQQLSGTVKRATAWDLKGTIGVTPLLSEPREYKVKLGGRTSRIAVQVAESPLGMVIRYSFAAEAGNLASMVVGIGEEDEGGDISLGTSAAALKPTMVMEVDTSEKVIVEVHEGYLSLAANGGGFLPMAGGDPGFMGGAQVIFNLPFANRMFMLSAQGLFQRHTLAVAVGDLDGGAIRANSAVYAIPILAKLTARLPLGSNMGAFAHAGGGLCYVSASRTSLGASQSATKWVWAARGGAGVEMNIKVGWLGVDVAYLYAPAVDYGRVLSGYSPAGPSLALQYRFGF